MYEFQYSGFYQVLSGCYIVFINCFAALTLSRKITRPKFLYEKLSPSRTLSYTITEKSKRVFYGAKDIEDHETPEGAQ